MDSFITWVGGKKLLRKEIAKRFPENIGRYVEVFGGAAWVLFYQEKYAPQEIYNDINGELVNLFKMVKYHSNAVQEELNWMLNAREIFEEFKIQKGMTEIQRAARFYYLIRASYGAKVFSYGGIYRDNTTILKNIESVKQRLSKVVIENKNFTDILKQYDKEDTLFYCDPPYYKAEKYYKTGSFDFDEKQHILLRDMLKDIKGKFVLSYNNDDFIKELYKSFYIEEVERLNNLASNAGKNKTYKELIIRNFETL